MKLIHVTLAAALLTSAACSDNPVVTPTNVATTAAIQGALTRSGSQTLAEGILAQDRGADANLGGVALPEIYARDVYRIDGSEPRWVLETLASAPDPSAFSGNVTWLGPYTTIRSATNYINAIPTAPPGTFTPAEASAALGFMKTIKALNYMRLLEFHDTVGVVIQSADQSAVDPLVCKEKGQAYTAALLDSAYSDLQAAGNSTVLPFALPSGFKSVGGDYSVVSNIIRFNRGLKGKLDLYIGLDHKAPSATAITTSIAELTAALGGAAPGTVSPSTFNQGPYYVFVVGGTENTPNPLADAKIGANPAVHDSIQPGDTRASKFGTRTALGVTPATLTGGGISTSYTFTNAVPSSANQTHPIGILRTEEIVLLRAQANIEAGNLPAALLDLNDVRTNYGLAATTFASQADARNKLLYEKRYSLLFEGDQRLVDLRAYGRLNSTYLHPETATDPYNSAFPIPKTESDARKGNITLSCS